MIMGIFEMYDLRIHIFPKLSKTKSTLCDICRSKIGANRVSPTFTGITEEHDSVVVLFDF